MLLDVNIRRKLLSQGWAKVMVTYLRTARGVAFAFSVRGITTDIDVHVIEKTIFKIWHELSSHRWVIFICFFCVMGLEGDTVCINNATHPSRPG